MFSSPRDTYISHCPSNFLVIKLVIKLFILRRLLKQLRIYSHSIGLYTQAQSKSALLHLVLKHPGRATLKYKIVSCKPGGPKSFFYFFPNFFFYKVEYTGGKVKKKKMKLKLKLKYEKKEFQSALFNPLGRWTGNNFLFKGGLGAKAMV